MPVVSYNTDYAGIIVKVDPAQSPIFEALVKEALGKIYSKPVGKGLIDGIINNGAAQFGYKVAIMRPDMTADKGAGDQTWKGGSRAMRISEDNACNGTGSVTRIDWNPNVTAGPDGARPPFIGLAHELVHALHNLMGNASKDTRKEEKRTVGLNAYLNVLPNENAIRQEHNVSHRASYKSEDFGDIIHNPAKHGALFTRL